MIRRFVAAMLTSAVLAAAAAPLARAEDAVKQVTPQQQKMKDCAAKWKDEKTSTGAKGREAYSKFMSGCLKAPAA